MSIEPITRAVSTLAFRRSALIGVGGLALGGLVRASHAPPVVAQPDPLPSWNDGPAKQALLDFVARVTDEGDDFFPEGERIASFDNDGTLWCERPAPVQLFFAIDRVNALAPEHPDWQDEEPFATILRGDLSALSGMSEQEVTALLAATHAGMTTAEFAGIASAWLATALHPRFDRLFTACVYQPQLELLELLRANGFQTWIVSGGGSEFMRAIPEAVYGIPPEQIIGSSGKVDFELRDGEPVFVKQPKISAVDNKAGKPININLHIGRRPLLAFGNSNGDAEMLQYAHPEDDGGPRLGLLVHHDDAEREYAYGPAGGLPDTHVGTFTQALMDEANRDGWVVVSMKNDWIRIFPWSR